MRIFVAGGSGAIGKRLVPLLARAGHTVVATTRTPEKAALLAEGGAEPIVLDALDRDAVMRAVAAARPEVVVHQMTAIPANLDPTKLDSHFSTTNKLRTEGTENLLDAARAAGAAIFVAQSYVGFPNMRAGGRITTEDDPYVPDPPEAMRQTLESIRTLERLVTAPNGMTGVVLRYGSFYGPGTSLGREGEATKLIRKGKFPIVGRGESVWSFIHVDDAAAATRDAIERRAGGIYNVVDDEPAALREWLPEVARVLGARAPMRLPEWIARLIVGSGGVRMLTEARGASNAKAKRELGWQPRWASWREGFPEALG